MEYNLAHETANAAVCVNVEPLDRLLLELFDVPSDVDFDDDCDDACELDWLLLWLDPCDDDWLLDWLELCEDACEDD